MTLDIQEEALEKNPDLKLAQGKFLLETQLVGISDAEKIELENFLMEKIRKENMAVFYHKLCQDLINVNSIKLDSKLYEEMKAENALKVQDFNNWIEDAEKNLTEMEVREKNLNKSEYLCRVGDFTAACEAFQKTYEKTVSLGQKLDIIFNLIRIGLFNLDHGLISKNIEKAKTLIDEGGDWDRRNRLKVYQGTYSMGIRDFTTAASLFLETISTFTSYELMDYVEFVRYTVIIGMIALPRNQLHQKIIKGAEIQEILHSPEQALLRSYVNSLYECKYAQFFKDLAEIEKILKKDRLLNPHYRFYVREMRIKAYTQLLESYSSLTLKYMADSFGVTQEFIDKELHRFIAAGRLHCKIDKVSGSVETNRPDTKNAQYQATIKQGDFLLNRIQKLSRVINI